jgi:hypothetical protein
MQKSRTESPPCVELHPLCVDLSERISNHGPYGFGPSVNPTEPALVRPPLLQEVIHIILNNYVP